MTPMPSTKAASLPSLRLLAPSARPRIVNTKQATGTENFLWISITGRCGEMPWACISMARACSSSTLSSRSPRAGPVRGNTLSGLSATIWRWNFTTS